MTPLLEVRNLKKVFPVGRGDELVAVDDVSLQLHRGEVLGIVGESGCGKSTLSRLIARLIDPTSGDLEFDGRSLLTYPLAAFSRAPARRRIQMVFQDATDSLNPRFTAFDCIADPVRRLAPCDKEQLQQLVELAAERVGLARELLVRRPHQLSGGQKARVGIARAIALDPSLLILDEPTSALDVSVQSVVLKTLAKLRDELGLAYVFISHDLKVVELLSDRVAVMYLGRVVEIGPTAAIFGRALHPYTVGLAAARPSIAPPGERVVRQRLEGESSSPINPNPHQCHFASRCARVHPRCLTEAPVLRHSTPTADLKDACIDHRDGQQTSHDPVGDAISQLHWVACHFPHDDPLQEER